MSSLAELPELVGFFSYSREDDEDSQGALSALRTRIQGELRGQLGRTANTFRLWQDKEAIPSGTLWETEIKNAVGQSVFFIPIITPTVIASPYCKFELESFLAREAELCRDDLVFPILYIDVPSLRDSARRQNDPVLSLIARRQYKDWRQLRHQDVRTTDVSVAVERFCADIRDALHKTWISPQERKEREQAEARRQAEAERQRQQAEAEALAKEAETRQRKEAVARSKREAEEARAQAALKHDESGSTQGEEPARITTSPGAGSTKDNASAQGPAAVGLGWFGKLLKPVDAPPLKPLTYRLIAIIGIVVGLLAEIAWRLGLYGVSLGPSLSDTDLLSAYRFLYVANLLVPFIRHLQAQSVLKRITVIVVLYLGETIFDAEMVGEATAAREMWVGALQMLLEWLFLAGVFLSLTDSMMIGVAAVGGIAIGVFDFVLIDVPNSGFITVPVSFDATALILAYGIRRQTGNASASALPNWLKNLRRGIKRGAGRP